MWQDFVCLNHIKLSCQLFHAIAFIFHHSSIATQKGITFKQWMNQVVLYPSLAYFIYSKCWNQVYGGKVKVLIKSVQESDRVISSWNFVQCILQFRVFVVSFALSSSSKYLTVNFHFSKFQGISMKTVMDRIWVCTTSMYYICVHLIVVSTC